jgi:hypothetical protein
MGAWNRHGWNGFWHIEHPHVVMAHMVGIGGQHQQGKKLGFKVIFTRHRIATLLLRSSGCTCCRSQWAGSLLARSEDDGNNWLRRMTVNT